MLSNHKQQLIYTFLNELFPVGTKGRQLIVRGVSAAHGSTKTFVIDVEQPELALQNFYPRPDYNYYYCPVTVSGSHLSREKAWQNNAVVIDCDLHNTDIDVDEAIRCLLVELEGLSEENGLIPMPNFVVRSGRGVQLVWKIVNFFAHSLSDIPKFSKDSDYKSPSEHVLNKFKRCLIHHLNNIVQNASKNSELAQFDVDGSASMNYMGLFRLPGTYNANISHYEYTVDYEKLHDVPLTYEIINKCQQSYMKIHTQKGVFGAVATLKSSKSQTKSKNTSSKSKNSLRAQGRPCTSHQPLLKWMKELRDYRSKFSSRGEHRNDFCWVYYAIAKSTYGDARAMELVKKFNAGFKTPLTDKELKNTLSSAIRKNYYCSANLDERFNVTEKELLALGPVPFYVNSLYTKPNKKLSNSKKNEISQHNTIMSMYITTDLSARQIANSLDVAPSTITRHLKKHADEIPQLIRTHKINQVLENNKAPTPIISVEIAEDTVDGTSLPILTVYSDFAIALIPDDSPQCRDKLEQIHIRKVEN